MGALLQDLRFALRSFRRAPAFPLAAIATLALGIGATTAIFSTLNAVLLKPLPYPQAEDLYNIRTTLTDGRVTTGMLSNGEISRLNDPNCPIVRAAGMQPADLTLLHAGRHAAARQGLRRHRRILRAVRAADDARRLHARALRAAPPPPPPPRRAGAAGPAAGAAGRRDLASRLAGPLSAAIRRSSASRSGSPRSRRRSPASRRATSTRRTAATSGSPAARQGRHQSLLRRLHAPEAGRDARARQRRDGADHGAASRATFPASDLNRAYVTKPLVASVVGDLGPILIIVMSATGLLLLLACVNVDQPAARARRRARARDGGARRARRAARPHRPPAAHRVGAAVDRRRGARRRCSPSSACARCSRSARRSCRASTRVTVRRARAAVRAGDARRQRAARRLRAGAAAGAAPTCGR